MLSKPKMKTILLAEDDPDDIYLISEAVDECGLEVQLFVVQNGEELLNYLYQRGNDATGEKAVPPDLILLDLNMPFKDGREALEEIKKDPAISSIPVIVLTTSSAEADLEWSYKCGASGYITKPSSFRELREVVNKIGAYWLSTVMLPENYGNEEGEER
jgi:CheY-like chemotaxis protein